MAYWRRVVGRGLLAAGLAGASGCLNFVNPVHPPPGVAEPCQAMSCYARRHVCVFLANGVDPLGLGNLSGVRQYLHSLGFTRTYYGQPYHGHWFAKELRRARKEDPEARFVLMGYGMGADTLRAVARSACQDGIGIDLFVSFQASPDGCLSPGMAPTCAGEGTAAFPLPEEQMLGSPTDARTLHLLAAELVEVAALVPVVAPAPLPEPESGPEVAPLPRPVNPSGIKAPDPGPEWQALRPVGELERYILPEPKVGPDPSLRELDVLAEEDDGDD